MFRPGWSLGSPGRQAGVLARLVSFSWLVTLPLVLGVILTNSPPDLLGFGLVSSEGLRGGLTNTSLAQYPGGMTAIFLTWLRNCTLSSLRSVSSPSLLLRGQHVEFASEAAPETVHEIVLVREVSVALVPGLA